MSKIEDFADRRSNNYIKEALDSLSEQIDRLEKEKLELQERLRSKEQVLSHKYVLYHLFNFISLGLLPSENPSYKQVKQANDVKVHQPSPNRGRSHSPATNRVPKVNKLSYGVRKPVKKQVIQLEDGRTLYKG
jgi:hypothetical protein